MPKIPGRKSTKPTFKIEDAQIGSFVLQHEERFWPRKCNAVGCDHQIGPDTTVPGWPGKFEPCDPKQLPGIVVTGDDPVDWLNQPTRLACPCCVAKILDQDKA